MSRAASSTPDERRGSRHAGSEPMDESPVAPTASATPAATAAEPSQSMRQEVVAREKEEFGGVKVGSAFFGWLTATGTAVILTALVAATGAAVGLGTANGDARQAADAASANADTVTVVGAVALLVVLFVSYLAGGYVAGRMARFNGVKQGIAVWLWAVVIAVVVAVIAALAGTQYDVLGTLNSFPRIPVGEGALTATGIVTVVVAALVSLAGAIVGGLAGMRFHRRVDRAGLGR